MLKYKKTPPYFYEIFESQTLRLVIVSLQNCLGWMISMRLHLYFGSTLKKQSCYLTSFGLYFCCLKR